ncbi:sulfite exporter TauE/SafE family protein [Kocuria indica]|uniref:sulfite exporter TauE/SafE family protein n=2 Tax=Kocuria TaxID=57493 RepID=UPI001EF7292F|nr:sulfite exporter TauE/SafE family protein [Kocuria sp.]MCG7432065.1 sulfite exporter TauE/SafE family protein [Kocuria indica]
MLPDLTWLAWVGLLCGAFLVGFSKTAMPGINTLAVALFAATLPARASTGVLLVLLLVGDCFALWSYRRYAHWPTLVRMMPAVIVGLALGGAFLAVAGDSAVRRSIGFLLLVLMGITLWQRRGRKKEVSAPSGEESHAATKVVAASYGTLGGFTTMVANVGGPVMTMYFLAARFPKRAFLGTAAWFFVTMNVLKVPISVCLGLLTAHTLAMDAVLVPGVVLGALVGKWAFARIAQHAFDRAVVAVTVLGALYLIL